eukprot:380777_1
MTEQKAQEQQNIIKDRKYLSLHNFSCEDICNEIKEWVINDINYQSQLSKMKTVFKKNKLSGDLMKVLDVWQSKNMVKNELKKFMTDDTIYIIFNSFNKWKKRDPDIVKTKTAEEIAHILFDYPLNNLLKRIKNENMNGKKFITSLDDNIIKYETGWNSDQVYQIISVLFRHDTFTKIEFKNHMNFVLTQYYEKKLLSKAFIDRIKEVIFEYDVEEIHYKIKNNKNFDEFSDGVMNLVDELILQNNNEAKTNNAYNEYMEDTLSKTIYQAIATCFIFKHKLNDDGNIILDGHILDGRRQSWICNNCSNLNVCFYTESELNMDLTTCTLCGVEQIEQIILKLRNHDTYIMTNYSDAKKEIKEEKLDELEDMIRTAAKKKNISLYCPCQNKTIECDSMIILAKMLIKFKRWLDMIPKDPKEIINIEKTIKVD